MVEASANSSRSATVADDRRRSERRPCICEAWIWSPTSSEDDDRRLVSALNLSRHGVGFESDQPVEPGTFHRIELRLGPQTIRAEIRILHCRRGDGGFEVGAEFH